MTSTSLERSVPPRDYVRAAESPRRVSVPLALGIAFLPALFVWFLLRNGHSTLARAIGFGWVAFLGLVTTLVPPAATPVLQPVAPSALAEKIAVEAKPAPTASALPEVSPPMAPSLSASDAFPICKEAVLDRITHPSTADFSILGIGFKSYDDGTAILGTTFTARNGFNLELEYQAACDFTGTTLTDVKIVEAR